MDRPRALIRWTWHYSDPGSLGGHAVGAVRTVVRSPRAKPGPCNRFASQLHPPRALPRARTCSLILKRQYEAFICEHRPTARLLVQVLPRKQDPDVVPTSFVDVSSMVASQQLAEALDDRQADFPPPHLLESAFSTTTAPPAPVSRRVAQRLGQRLAEPE